MLISSWFLQQEFRFNSLASLSDACTHARAQARAREERKPRHHRKGLKQKGGREIQRIRERVNE